jgi:hypothetical protein
MPMPDGSLRLDRHAHDRRHPIINAIEQDAPSGTEKLLSLAYDELRNLSVARETSHQTTLVTHRCLRPVSWENIAQWCVPLSASVLPRQNFTVQSFEIA